MNQTFDDGLKAFVNRDNEGIARDILVSEERYVSSARTPQLAAREYLDKFGSVLGVQPDEIRNLGLTPEQDLVDAGVEYRFLDEKSQFDTTTVAYQQTYFGLPVWEAGLAVHLKRNPFQILSAQSTRHADIKIERPSADALGRLKEITPELLIRVLGLTPNNEAPDLKSLDIQSQRLIIYRYESAKRVHTHDVPGTPKAVEVQVSDVPSLPLPPVGEGIQDGQHYVASEVHFILGVPRFPDLRWVAIIEANTLTVLYLRAYVDSVNGMVFQDDPMTDNGGPLPNATNAALNPVRTSVLLQGLNPPVGLLQFLMGSNVTLIDSEAPTVAPPLEVIGVDFNFDARTDGFAAVNAYYHTDRFFRLLEDLGFSKSSYLSGTSFPSSVDHRGSMNTTNGIEVNAHCLGTGTSGILRTTFALADTGNTTNPIGIACDWRVVLHELGGHGILYNHVNTANFGFAHSAGDSFAAILNDPDTHAPDRFVTFPWVNIGRRHDRLPAAGWGWGGVNDTNGYNSEQILCTTHFRIYRSIGGDSADLNMRRFASRFAAYLILRAVGSLTPATNPGNVSGYATALITADLGDWTSEGQSGGAYGKVIRWAFEKQGLYQAPGSPTPVITEGAPPVVDVYIEDGRHGEYTFQPNHWSNQSIWNRRSADGLTTHQEPVVGQTNYAYVKIKNRGTQTATNVVVKGFHCNPGTGLVWPNDWQPMTTAQLSAANVAPNNAAEIVVGPFEWTPSQVGHECMLMIASATGDASNINNFTAGDSIPEWRLVPHDNNIGQRNVHPVAAGGGIKGLVASAKALHFWMRNPQKAPSRMVIKTSLPAFLVEKGWGLDVSSAGGGSFSLAAGELREVTMRFKVGGDFTPEEAAKAANSFIRIETYADGILTGGMSYPLDPTMKAPYEPKPISTGGGDKPGEKCLDTARSLLDCLNLSNEKVKSVKVKKITVEIDLHDDDC